MKTDISIAEYLLLRLKEIGLNHIFGVPGDFVMGFYNEILKSEIQYVGTCNELNAAYAADGYARIQGIGAFSTTYGVGELSALNGLAGAFAERVPVVAITGSPATFHYSAQPLLHHTLGDYRIPMQMFERITVASTLLSNPSTAPAEIDRVLYACLYYQMPVYISFPSDVVQMRCAPPTPFVFPVHAPSNPEVLQEAISEAKSLLLNAQRPLLIGGVELIRFRLQSHFASLLKATGFPYVTMMLGKSVLSENHPQYLGLYEGDRSRQYVLNQVEKSDCILQLGEFMTDFNTGGFTTKLKESKLMSANLRSVRIHNHVFENVYLPDFINGLIAQIDHRDSTTSFVHCAANCAQILDLDKYGVIPSRLICIQRLFDRMSIFMAPHSIVLAETGVSLFSAAEMRMPPGGVFIGQSFYGSIGYTIGACLGVSLASPDRDVFLFIGDGAFQVTCQDISTMVRNHLRPIIVLLNNDGYTIERVICDRTYNDIQAWKYHKILEVFGGGLSFDVHTEGELESALQQCKLNHEVVLMEVHTDRMDCSNSLHRAGHSMAIANHLA